MRRSSPDQHQPFLTNPSLLLPENKLLERIVSKHSQKRLVTKFEVKLQNVKLLEKIVNARKIN